MRNSKSVCRPLFSFIVLACVPWFLCSEVLWARGADAGPLASPVVGGRPAERGEWPDVVAVVLEDGLCTGTLLTADVVLTAAHCIEANPVEVVIGSIDLAKPDGDRRAVKWARAYPDWLARYDVGVIMLENPVAAKARAIAQGCTKRLKRGTRLQVVGFGLTTTTATDSNVKLNAASIAVADPSCERDPACQAGVAPYGELTAGGKGADACFGDSGGPAYIATASGPALLGVVSRGLLTWGDPCGEGGVFVRADKVLRWIEATTNRVVERVACDVPADDPDDDRVVDEPGATEGDGGGFGGCNAAGAGLLGGMHGGLAVAYALLCIAGLRRARWRRRA